MIRSCNQTDINAIYAIINDSASAYKGVIPDDRWHEPYMSHAALRQELDNGVAFWGETKDRHLVGVLGVQDKGEVNLIRHAYVLTAHRNQGVGSRLLRFVESMIDKPILIGTWAAATWAVAFYRANGYRVLEEQEKNRLLDKYWDIPERQIQTSLVLASHRWCSPA